MRTPEEDEEGFWEQMMAGRQAGNPVGPAHADGGFLPYLRAAWSRWCHLAGIGGAPVSSGAPEIAPAQATTTPAPGRCLCPTSALMSSGHVQGCPEGRVP